MWRIVPKFDPVANYLADRHYSRQRPGSPNCMPPGQTMVLVSADNNAVFGWWRPHPRSGLLPWNGMDCWMCTIFRNEGRYLSSDLIISAEQMLLSSSHTIGPDGFVTYVWPEKLRSANPGCCFKKAGWKKAGISQDGKKILFQKRLASEPLPPVHTFPGSKLLSQLKGL